MEGIEAKIVYCVLGIALGVALTLGAFFITQDLSPLSMMQVGGIEQKLKGN